MGTCFAPALCKSRPPFFAFQDRFAFAGSDIPGCALSTGSLYGIFCAIFCHFDSDIGS